MNFAIHFSDEKIIIIVLPKYSLKISHSNNNNNKRRKCSLFSYEIRMKIRFFLKEIVAIQSERRFVIKRYK